MDIREVSFGSPEYLGAVALREAVLRQPLGLVLSAADVAGEDRQVHVVAVEEGVVQATVLLKAGKSSILKLRQMAVDPARHGTGLGKAVVAFAEALAAERGFTTVSLHARLAARGFYEKAGYRAEGPVFIEVGLPHVAMTKAITS